MDAETEAAKREYRIVTDGVTYRVQRRRVRGWFRKREVWEFCCNCDGEVIEHATLQAARQEMAAAVAELAAYRRGWTVVEEIDNGYAFMSHKR